MFATEFPGIELPQPATAAPTTKKAASAASFLENRIGGDGSGQAATWRGGGRGLTKFLARDNTAPMGYAAAGSASAACITDSSTSAARTTASNCAWGSPATRIDS